MKDKRKFQEVVRGIRDAERDVDSVLRAAKMERRERRVTPIDGDTLLMVLVFVAAMAFLLGVFAILR